MRRENEKYAQKLNFGIGRIQRSTAVEMHFDWNIDGNTILCLFCPAFRVIINYRCVHVLKTFWGHFSCQPQIILIRGSTKNAHQHVFTQTPRTCYSLNQKQHKQLTWNYFGQKNYIGGIDETARMNLDWVEPFHCFMHEKKKKKKIHWLNHVIHSLFLEKWSLPSSLFLNSLSWHALVSFFCIEVTNVYLSPKVHKNSTSLWQC